MTLSRALRAACLCGLIALAAPIIARAASPTLDLDYAGNVLGVADGGLGRAATYSHSATLGGDWSFGNQFDIRVSAAWTQGPSLSENAVGDVGGVQGTYNGGDALYLYELAVGHQGDKASWSVGRLSASDLFGAPDGAAEFVNGTISSSGGAISLNDPGRATSPSASWGAVAGYHSGALNLSGGAFLSDPARTSLTKHGVDFSFRPADGVLAFGELDWSVSPTVTLGLGTYADTAAFDAFDGRRVKGQWGSYAFVQGRLRDGPSPLTGFAMLQSAPRDDRSVQPLYASAGLTLHAPLTGRPNDDASIGAYGGQFSRLSGLGGWESGVEANYRMAMGPRWGLRPDMQYIVHPGGEGGHNALVVGAQLEFSLH